MKKYKLICMAFDGDFITEHSEFDSIEAAWEHSTYMGSKWYFFPFHFVVTMSGKTIRDAGEFLEWTKGMRTKTVKRIFKAFAALPENEGMEVEEFAISVG